MPIYEIVCNVCKRNSEVLVMGSDPNMPCPHCGSLETNKIMSPTSSLTGSESQGLPGPRDTGCCGSSPARASNCAGPGSCCGRS
jgi:putative FmdB family regulatory protein